MESSSGNPLAPEAPVVGGAANISKAEDLIFTKRRLSLCAYAFLAANVIAFAIRFYTGKWMVDKAGHPAYIDFL